MVSGIQRKSWKVDPVESVCDGIVNYDVEDIGKHRAQSRGSTG